MSPQTYKRFLLLVQFFLIIIVYHLLRDLKDTVVITASNAGAQVIPFIKIWAMLPLAVFAGYAFTKVYQRFGREKSMYFFISILLVFYAAFAFVLHPYHDSLQLNGVCSVLSEILPGGCRGFVSMIVNWNYTLFYLSAELWAIIILSVLFWGYVNEITTFKQAKTFYPLCMTVGNCAGIVAGQSSHYLCHSMCEVLSWTQTLQVMMMIVVACGLGIMLLTYLLNKGEEQKVEIKEVKKKPSMSFKESVACVLQSKLLLSLAILVIGFGLTTNLIEVIWKESIKRVHDTPQAYNAYINQLTSLIGLGAVITSLASRWMFRVLSWTGVAIITPIILLVTSSAFFMAFHVPDEVLVSFSALFEMNPMYMIMTLGSIYYLFAMTAKYTIFDMSKEMAFLSLGKEERMRAKAVIDSIGARLGKSGASGLYQVLLIAYESTFALVPIVGSVAFFVIALTLYATRQLGTSISIQAPDEASPVAN